MYKININKNVLIVEDTAKIMKKQYPDGALIAPYAGKSKILLSYIDMLEKTDRIKMIVIHSHNYKALKEDLKSLFKIVKASGGLVMTSTDDILFIYRRGHWDLPKGKIDEGEGKKQAALREVEEETGVKSLVIKNKITTTKHTYRLKNGGRAIKKTYWYLMNAPKQALIPQTEEDIEKAIWAKPEYIMQLGEPIYQNIRDVLQKAHLL